MTRKNKRPFKKALVFASAFIIILMSLTFTIFAQAPNFDSFNNFENSRTYRLMEIYDNGYLLYNIYYDFTLQDIYIVFTEYFYQNYYMNHISTDSNGYTIVDFESLYNSSVDSYFNLYGIYSNGSQISQSGNRNVNVEDYLSSRLDIEQFRYVFENGLESQFLYWQNQISDLENNNLQYSKGYTQALEDYNAFESGLYTIFNAPFTFVRNIVGFEVFGITLADILCGVLLLCLGFVLLKFIGGAIPL